MRAFLLGLSCLLLATSSLPAHGAAESVMTAPRNPSAGQPTTLVFRATALAYDLDASTLPAASVNGSSIRINLNDECGAIFCDVVGTFPFKVELPALDEGDYEVDVFGFADDDFSRGSFTFSVGPAVDIATKLPSEGAWSDQSKPGTGLYLQTRGALLSVAQFDYLQDQAHWRLDVTPMRGDSALVLLSSFSRGSCFGCVPFVPPSNRSLGGTPLLITFDSARRARAELSDGTIVPLVSLPFGADYVPVTLTDLPDEEFGSIPLPDLSGTWAYRDRIVSFGPPEIEGQSVRFPAVGNSLIELVCGETVSGSARCALIALPSPTGPVIFPLPPIAFAPLGDIEENRIRMTGVTPAGSDFYMVRIPSAD